MNGRDQSDIHLSSLTMSHEFQGLSTLHLKLSTILQVKGRIIDYYLLTCTYLCNLKFEDINLPTQHTSKSLGLVTFFYLYNLIFKCLVTGFEIPKKLQISPNTKIPRWVCWFIQETYNLYRYSVIFTAITDRLSHFRRRA